MINDNEGTFSQQRWLVAHNAWNTQIAPNQKWNITQLLDYGVRGLALDIYGDSEDTLHLQHGHDNPASATNWSQVRDEIAAWLAGHPNDVVTLFFESYLKGPGPGMAWNSKTPLYALSQSLTKRFLPGTITSGGTRTEVKQLLREPVPFYKEGRSVQEDAMKEKLSTLIARNHRLFAFIEREPDEGAQSIFPVMTATFAENVYGDDSLRIPTWVNLRKGSNYNNPVRFMNHFGNAPSGSEWDRNDKEKILDHAKQFFFSYGAHYPNFISLDYINWDSQRRGPIEAMEALGKVKDAKGVTPFGWNDTHSFDGVTMTFPPQKITGFTVKNVGGQGIVEIAPAWSASGPGVREIELVSVKGIGVVNMRFKRMGENFGAWLTQNETAADGGNVTSCKQVAQGDMIACCCRTAKGYGVVDFATAYS